VHTKWLTLPRGIGLLLLACVLVAFFMTADWWVLRDTHLLREFMLVIAALYAVTLGVWFLRRDNLPSLGSVANVVAAISIMLVSVEGMLQIAGSLIDLEPQIVDHRQERSVYRNTEWADEYFQELHDQQSVFKQYLMWRRSPYEGLHINIEPGGFRHTVQAYNGLQPDTILVFGGSTLWGTGARDSGTIPSQLARRLSAVGPYHVVNCGESAYQFSQEVLYLSLLLRDGVRPQIVVFYDGVNEVYNAWQDNNAVTVYNHDYLESRFGKSGVAAQLGDAVYRLLTERVYLFQVVKKLESLIPERDTITRFDEVTNSASLDSLAGAVRDEYNRSLGLLDVLARQWGFDYACFWQPVMYTESVLTPEEQTYVENSSAELRYLYNRTRGLVAEIPSDAFYDISDVLSGHDSTVYIDYCHISEAGNAVVADRIGERLSEMSAER
jgi:hypothetical protein